MSTATLAPTTGEVCRDCGKPVSARCKFRLCALCKRRRTCAICRRMSEGTCWRDWCSDCMTMWDTCNVVRALGVKRPDPVTLRERLTVYQARASLGLPLFHPPV